MPVYVSAVGHHLAKGRSYTGKPSYNEPGSTETLAIVKLQPSFRLAMGTESTLAIVESCYMEAIARFACSHRWTYR